MIKTAILRVILVTTPLALAAAGAAVLVSGFSVMNPAVAASSKLGDLEPFRSMVVDTAAMVDKGDLAGAKARIKDLETSWDDAEPSLKPRAAADWHIVDKAIDRALNALRASVPDAASCKQSLSDLLTAMDPPGGKA